MSHANDDLVNPCHTTPVDQVVEHRDQAVSALEREPLLPDVTRVQVALDTLGTGQLLEDGAPFLVTERGVDHVVLEVLAQPQALTRPGYMRKFDRRLAAINGPEQGDDVAQPHTRVAGPRETARVELGVHVGLGQAEVVELEDAREATLHQAERIDIRDLVPAQAVDLDESGNSGLLFGGRCSEPAIAGPELPRPTAVAR